MKTFYLLPLLCLVLPLKAQVLKLFFGDTLFVEPGSVIEVAAKVDHFNNIAAFGCALGWDNSKVKLLQWSSTSSIDALVNVQDGVLRVAWASTTGQGVSLPAAATFLTLRFSIKDTSNFVTSIEWLDQVYPTEFSKYINGKTENVPIHDSPQIIVTRACKKSIHLIKKGIACEGDSIWLSVDQSDYKHIQWSTGSNNDVIWIKEKSLFKVVVEWSQKCFSEDSIAIEFSAPPTLSLPKSIQFCPDQSTDLHVQTNGKWIEWSTGDTTAMISITETGLYHVTVTNEAGCESRDSIKATITRMPILELGRDTVLCEGETIKLYSSFSVQEFEHIWENGQKTSSLNIQQPGIYRLTLSKESCSVEDSIKIDFVVCQKLDVYIPNVFNPNGSKGNSNFKPLFDSKVEVLDFNFAVFDRWGNKVFSTYSWNEGWGGQVGNQGANQGIFIYKLRLSYRERLNKVKQVERIGEVLLVR
jgi:CHU_C Type IX secretion signal domain